MLVLTYKTEPKIEYLFGTGIDYSLDQISGRLRQQTAKYPGFRAELVVLDGEFKRILFDGKDLTIGPFIPRPSEIDVLKLLLKEPIRHFDRELILSTIEDILDGTPDFQWAESVLRFLIWKLYKGK